MGGYVIPKNLQHERDAYIFSFANRTKKNLQFIKEKANKDKEVGKIGRDATVYEVTQLINSMIGLVTFPKEAFYEKALRKGNGQYASTYLVMLIENLEQTPEEFDYENTYLHFCKRKYIYGQERCVYSKNKTERLTVLTFIRHFRNALSHEKLSVYPYSLSPGDDIKGFIFEDERVINVVDIGQEYIEKKGLNSMEIQQKFKIKLTVEQIEAVAIDICDMLLAVAKDTYKIRDEVDKFY